ncbi:MAG: hypothetical protein ABI547_05430, partial [Betaproteobacteria bacterium]
MSSHQHRVGARQFHHRCDNRYRRRLSDDLMRPTQMIRLQDSGESELAFNMKAPKHGFAGWVQNRVKGWLKSRGYTEPCILIVGFEGEEKSIAATRRSVLGILKRHGSFPLGKSAGKTWSKDKFNIPYLRDYVMDYGCMADVAETSALW